jgi:hypothetical protein
MAPFPQYNRQNDGNVFEWILRAAQQHREVRFQERLEELERKQNDHERNTVIQP